MERISSWKLGLQGSYICLFMLSSQAFIWRCVKWSEDPCPSTAYCSKYRWTSCCSSPWYIDIKKGIPIFFFYPLNNMNLREKVNLETKRCWLYFIYTYMYQVCIYISIKLLGGCLGIVLRFMSKVVVGATEFGIIMQLIHKWINEWRQQETNIIKSKQSLFPLSIEKLLLFDSYFSLKPTLPSLGWLDSPNSQKDGGEGDLPCFLRLILLALLLCWLNPWTWIFLWLTFWVTWFL